MRKLIAVINLPDDVEKTNAVFENLGAAAFKKKADILMEIEGLENEDNVLTAEDIDSAEAVIFVSNSDFPKERFGDKPIIEIPPDEAAQDAENVIQKALDLIEPKIVVVNKEEVKVMAENQPNAVYKHLGSGATSVVPLVIAGGLLTFVSYFFGIDTKLTEGFGGTLVKVATATLGFIVPILAAFIAQSVNDKAFVPGLVGGLFAATMGAGFLGGIVAGFVAGYVVKWLVQYIKFPQTWEGFKSSIVVPLLAVFVVGLVMVYVADPVVKWLADLANDWAGSLSTENVLVFGLVLGLFAAFDFGGVFSKAAFASAFALVGTGVFVPQAAVLAAAMVPPLGLALATVVAANKFNAEEKESGKAAWLLGLTGLTEGYVPFAIADPFRVIPAAMVGSAVTGLLSAAFGAGVNVANGGLFAFSVTGAVTVAGGWLLSVIVGVVVTAYLVKFLKK